MFKFVGEVRLLEAETKHTTKLSTSSPIVWLVLGMTIFPAIAVVLFFLGVLSLLPIFLLAPSIIAQTLAYIMYYFLFWCIAPYPFYKIWKMMQESLNTSWALWFGKV